MNGTLLVVIAIPSTGLLADNNPKLLHYYKYLAFVFIYGYNDIIMDGVKGFAKVQSV